MKKQLGSFWLEKCDWGAADAPLLKRGIGQEEEFPWRTGECIIIRAPFTAFALAFGRWTGEQPHEHDEDGPRLSFRKLDLEEVLRVREDKV